MEKLLLSLRNESNLWREVGPRLRSRIIDEARTGIVLATRSPSFQTHALNQREFDFLLDAKRTGKIDQAYVVTAAIVDGGYDYVGVVEAEELASKLKEHGIEPREGVMGKFFVLPIGLIAVEWM